MNESDKELILAKTVRRKIRTLKPYEKNFIKKGEFRYLVPQLETIESGNPTVCYTLSHRHGSTVLHNGINLENRIYSHETVLSTINEVDTEQEHSDMTTTVLEEPGVASNSVFDSNENRAHAEFLDDAEVYFQQLKIDQGISIFASAGRVLVLREYCAKRKNLHPAKFVLIERRSLCFCNAEYRWAYWCSCSVDRAREIAAFEHHINLSYEEFCNNYPDCIHLQVARMIFQQYDTSNDIEALEQITETASKPILLAVIWPVELSLNIVKRQFWRIKTIHIA